jgi:putative flippase GtrA
MKELVARTKALAVKRKNLLNEAGKYFIVGGICTVLDFCILYILTEYMNVHYLTSSVISFMSSVFLNYYLCTYWIFKFRIVSNRNLELFYYIIITAVGLGINSLFIWYFTSLHGYHFMLSKLFATFVTYWWNFGARKYFLHSKLSVLNG